jgi:hypothetical protein
MRFGMKAFHGSSSLSTVPHRKYSGSFRAE